MNANNVALLVPFLHGRAFRAAVWRTMLGLALVQSVFTAFAKSGPGGPGIGDAPPALELSTVLQGPSVAEVCWDKLHGKVVVLEFWDTRCAPCVAAIPHWNELVQQFDQKPVVFLSVSDENPQRITDFLKRRPIKGWVAVDGSLAATFNSFEVRGIPHTVIVDAAGKIAAITNPAKLEARHLDEVLAGKPSSLPALKGAREDEDSEVVSVATLAAENQRMVEVSIRGPFPQPRGAYNNVGWTKAGSDFRADKANLKNALAKFFDVSLSLVFEETKLPEELYDITVIGPEGKAAELRAQFLLALKTAFGITALTNSRTVEVYALMVASTNVSGLKRVEKWGGGGGKPGGFSLGGNTMETIASYLESALDRPVINETAETNLWVCELKWEMSAGELLLPRLDALLDDKTSEMLNTISFDDLPRESLNALSREELVTLKSELAKPRARRFQPEPAKVMAAARQQLGLELKPVKRTVTIVEILAAD